MPDYTFICWDARPHPRFGTLEVRLMDAQCSLERAAGLSALVQGLARYAVEHPARGQDVIRQVADLFARPAQDRHLQAVVRPQVDM